MSDCHKWLCLPRNAPTHATLNLFCFPPAGQGAWVYHHWQTHLPTFIQIVPVELPGRGSRINEPSEDSLPKLVSAIVSELGPLFAQKPFALFGHSMGALLAYEVETLLRKLKGPRPNGLLVSGYRAPHLPDVDESRLGHLDFAPFWDAFFKRYGTCADVSCEHVRQYIYPALQSDFR